MGEYLERLRLALERMEGCLRHRPRELDLILTPEIRARASALLVEASELAGDGLHAAEVAHERERFERWSRLVVERARYATPERVEALPLSALALDASPEEEQRLVLLDRISLLPPERNAAWVVPYADDEAIGLLIDCAEERVDELVIRREHSSGATYAGDNVEIFLAATPEAETVYHFIINPEGYRCASECRGTRWNWAWSSGYSVQTRVRADGWQVRFTIPRRDIGATAGFCFSVARNRHVEGWEITGLPEGGAFFNARGYLPVV